MPLIWVKNMLVTPATRRNAPSDSAPVEAKMAAKMMTAVRFPDSIKRIREE
jgi:hypothetical protein